MKQLKLITMLNLLRIQLNNSHFFVQRQGWTRPGVQQCQAQGLIFSPWLGSS